MFKHSTPIPLKEDLEKVHPPPTRLLHPSIAADRPYHLIMKEKLWRSWSGDSFGIKYLVDGNKEGPPFEVGIKGKTLDIRDRMVVQDDRGVAVAVILSMFLKFETTFKIYTFTPNHQGQAPSKNQKHETKDLYEWATCKDKFMSVRKTLETIDGVKYVMDGVGSVFVGKRQMCISREGKPCMHAKEVIYGFLKGNQWELRIGHGIDPVLMVAYMAIMDEMNEEN